MTIDRPARNFAADLIGRFKDGEISNDEFMDEWPWRSKDPAIKAISHELWFTYSDLKNHTLIGKYALNAKGVALYERCILFLQSEEEYVWPKSQGILPGIYGWLLLIMSLGLLLPLDRWFQRRNFEAMGDADVWPFISKADYDRVTLNIIE
jgi:hypothetical protein